MSDISLKFSGSGMDSNFNLLNAIPSEEYAGIAFPSKNFIPINGITAAGTTLASQHPELVDDTTIQFYVDKLKELSKKTYNRLTDPTNTGGIELGIATRTTSKGIFTYNVTIQKALMSTTQGSKPASATFKFQPL
jgi:hypothetical protein